MNRVALRSILATAVLAASVWTPAPSSAQSASPQIDSLIAMVRQLQVMVAEQAMRISVLEDALREVELQGVSSASPINRPPTPEEVAQAAVEEGVPGWHSAENWWRIQSGMSYEEVVAILGPPTNIRGGYSLRTLQYQGEVPGSGFVQGEVGIYGDANRVFRIKRPEFGGGSP